MLEDARDEVLDALFPPRCYLCDDAAADGIACARHTLAAESGVARCGRCAARLGRGVPEGESCAECRADPPSFAATVALGDYRDRALREWVLAFKHGARRDLAWPLGVLLAERCRRDARFASAQSVVAVPLHALRRFERGYDQARLLAEVVAQRLQLRRVNALRRVRSTAPQGEPGAYSRAANVRGAFGPRRWAAGRLREQRVLLVDDVLTSGATSRECARELKRLGATEVRVACLARASRGDFGEASE